jgi:biopolymer transport protein ExbD
MRFRGYKPADTTGMQLAPMIDIVFLLLIFFIVTWSYARFETELDISLPAASKSQEPNRLVGEIVVNVHKDGRMIIEGAELTDEKLLGMLSEIVTAYKDQAVILRGDKETSYENIMRVLNICKEAGIWNISFATERERTPAPQ